MTNKILRDKTQHLEELEGHEGPVFMGLDFGYPEIQNVIEIELWRIAGVPKAVFIQRPKSRQWRL